MSAGITAGMAFSALAGPVIGGLMGGGGGGGGGSSGGSAPYQYVPTQQPQVDQNYLFNKDQYQGNLNQYQGMTQPYAQQNFQNQYNNPQAQQYLQSAGNAGNMYGLAAGNSFQGGEGMYGAGQQAYQTGFDPRQQIYNQNRSDLTDNIRSSEYARGIGMSPAGASVEADALGRFQNDWQNQQQSRQLQGLQGMGRAYGQGGQMQGQGAQYSGMQGQQLFNAQNDVYGQQRDAISNYTNSQQTYMQGLNQLQSNDLGYMNFGQGAQNQAFNQNAANQQANNQAYGSIGQSVGTALNNGGTNAISNWWQSQQTPTYSGYQGLDPYAASQSGDFIPQGL